MPHTATHQQTQKPVQTTLPTGAFTPQQSQASQDVLSLMQKMVSKPTLATGTAILQKRWRKRHQKYWEQLV